MEKKKISKIGIVIAGVLLLISSVLATETTITPEKLNMNSNDTKTATFCIMNDGSPVSGAQVVVDPVCKDTNAMLGCNLGDVFNPNGFNVTPWDNTTGSDGCTNLTVSTRLTGNDSNNNGTGTYYFTVNGKMADATIGAETGVVSVPEMGTLASAVVLLGAGLFIASRRKNFYQP